MGQWCGAHKVEIWAYCLMPNHVHLIAVPQAPDGLRRVIGEVHRRYTRMVNFREGWRGHLWQGRFASFVLDEPHLLSGDEPAGLCPRCLLSDTRVSKTEIPPVNPSSRRRSRRKLTLASAVAAIGAPLGGLWFGNRRGQQPADAEALFNRGIDLHRQGKLDEAIAAYLEAIRIRPDVADAHNTLGTALSDQGKLEEAVAEFRKARDNAQRGSELAKLIERELNATDH